MPQQQQPEIAGSFQEKKQLAIALAVLVALPVQLFMRRRMGDRRLRNTSLYIAFGGLLALNWIGNFHVGVPLIGTVGATRSDDSLKYFAFLVLAVGSVQRYLRRKEFESGVDWFGYFGGYSWFEGILPLDRKWILRVVDPFAVFLIGYVMRAFLGLTGLGWYWCFAAAALAVVEAYAHEQEEERLRIERDNRLEAEGRAHEMARRKGQGQAAKPGERETSGMGLPTGADAGLAAQFARNRKEAGFASGPESGAGASDGNEFRPGREEPGLFAGKTDGRKIAVAMAVMVILALLFFGNNLRRASAQLKIRNEAILQLRENRQGKGPAATRNAVLPSGRTVTPPVVNAASQVRGAGISPAPITQGSIPGPPPAVATDGAASTANAPGQGMSAQNVPLLGSAKGPGASQPSTLTGIWQGAVATAEGFCTLRLDIQEHDDGKVSGQSNRDCSHVERGLAVLDVTVTSFSGLEINHEASLHGEEVLKKMGRSKGCLITSMTLIPDGPDGLLAQYRDQCDQYGANAELQRQH